MFIIRINSCNSRTKFPMFKFSNRNFQRLFINNYFVKLFFFSRTAQSRRRRRAAGNHLRNRIEISCADKRLMFRRAVAAGFRSEFLFLQFRVGGHLFGLIIFRQFEHPEIKRMKTGKCNKLKFVAHRAEFVLEFCNRFIIEFFLPVK